MTRFFNMIGLLRMSMQSGNKYCFSYSNRFCFKVLRLLTDFGFISGYCHDYIRRNLKQGFYHGYPRTQIRLKFRGSRIPHIIKLQNYHNTNAYFKPLIKRYVNSLFISDNTHLLLTGPSGLALVNNSVLLSSIKNKGINYKGNRILLRLSI